MNENQKLMEKSASERESRSDGNGSARSGVGEQRYAGSPVGEQDTSLTEQRNEQNPDLSKLKEYTDNVSNLFDQMVEANAQKIQALEREIADLHNLISVYEVFIRDDDIQDAAAKRGLRVAEYLRQEMLRLARCADYAIVPVDKAFWAHVKSICANSGVEPEAVMISEEMTRRLLSLVDNSLI